MGQIISINLWIWMVSHCTYRLFPTQTEPGSSIMPPPPHPHTHLPLDPHPPTHQHLHPSSGCATRRPWVARKFRSPPAVNDRPVARRLSLVACRFSPSAAGSRRVTCPNRVTAPSLAPANHDDLRESSLSEGAARTC